ncbi:MAG: shikimate dehydrogenase [Anaerolineae bacterium]|nr:shikimate dehydrogenase [Anaerolineae bacterium]
MEETFEITRKTSPTMYFIGVTTGQSSIRKVFPRWMEILGRPEVVLEGVDCKIHDDPQVYRRAVAQIKYDPLSLGALVTTHKIDLLNAARDMFDELDEYARITGEVSSISKRAGRLLGHAKDPITSGLSLDAILGSGYFGRTGGEVLCFGAGGSAIAILLHFISRPHAADRPRRFVFVNRSQPRLDQARQMVQNVPTDIAVEYICCHTDPNINDGILASMPPGSLIINATGMGKDTPGSPISDHGVFPMHSVVWELNYRGKLDFLHQARAQEQARQLTVADGWLYFVHGWTQVVAQVLDFDLTPELFARLEQAAAAARA